MITVILTLCKMVNMLCEVAYIMNSGNWNIKVMTFLFLTFLNEQVFIYTGTFASQELH